MDPRFLPFQIAAGLLLAAAILFMIRFGVLVYRRNDGWRSLMGGALVCCGVAFGWSVILAGFGA